jgi:beta-1,4-N-acetylglucosaminyltransferase
MILLVCSSGGHLTQLYNLKGWWDRMDRVWVTFDKPDATSLLAGESVIWAYHPTTRNLWNLLRNFVLAWRTVGRLRPDIVVSTGAAVAFPFFLVAKLRGSRTVYVEVFDRMDSSTMTGRLCYPISDRFLLQWEEQKTMYPKGEVVGPLL